MATISFNKGKYDEWESDLIANSLRVIVRNIACKFGGVYVTSLIRDKTKNYKSGGVTTSRHVPENNESGLCSASDFVLQQKGISPELVIADTYSTFEQILIIYHDVGSGSHFHLEVRPSKAFPVEIKF